MRTLSRSAENGAQLTEIQREARRGERVVNSGCIIDVRSFMMYVCLVTLDMYHSVCHHRSVPSGDPMVCERVMRWYDTIGTDRW
jgi:hypothetical protein